MMDDVASAVRRLRRKPTNAAADRDDVDQELALGLLSRIPKFDATKGNLTAFLHLAAKRLLLNQRRRLRAIKRAKYVCSLAGADANDVPIDVTSDADRRLGVYRRDAIEHADLRHDLAHLLDNLPAELSELAEQLKNDSLSEIARRTGKSRGKLRGQLRQLREHFDAAGLREYLPNF